MLLEYGDYSIGYRNIVPHTHGQTSGSEVLRTKNVSASGPQMAQQRILLGQEGLKRKWSLAGNFPSFKATVITEYIQKIVTYTSCD